MTPRFALQQPLVSRPAYGQVQEEEFAEWEGSELPGAGPGGGPLPEHSGLPKPLSPPGQNTAAAPVAESGLPQGDPGGKGITLNKDIPGESTYNKPEGDVRDFDKGDDSDPWRRDSPDDQLKERNVVDVNEDNAEKHDGIGEMGKGKWDTTVKTKYPYRDGLPHQHYASAHFVAGQYLVERAHDLRVSPGHRLLVGSKPDEVVQGLNPQFAQRAKSCGVTLKRVDAGNLRWLFSVNCGNGPKVVKLKAFRSSNVVRLGKMDIDVGCSCPAWQWLGPEHHAKREDYLDGSPRGTASTPVIRDPQGINRVCKHVAAVLSFVQGWEVPAKPKKR